MKELQIKNLFYSYKDGREKERIILNNINVSFTMGKFYTIVGASGSGKTTLLSVISTFDKPTSGEIYCFGKTLQDIGYDTYRQSYIGIVFQNYNLIPYMTAEENVRVVLQKTRKNEAREKAMLLLAQLGIDNEKAMRRVSELSGGEQQRVAIARALITDASIIIADEPTGNLDQNTSQEIIQIFKNLAATQGKCVIMVTHDLAIAEQSDSKFILNNGSLVEEL